MGDALQFLVGEHQTGADGLGQIGVLAGEVDEVDDGLERIVDFVGDGRGETPNRGEALGGKECCFELVSLLFEGLRF